ncbi:MAG: DEAD/DEAH box helicase [Planctomycetes bacterium]|nr:DEAD/DEAH box helicase [Planctomycetota bacterium]
MSVFRFLTRLQSERRRDNPIVHVENLPVREARYGELGWPLAASVQRALERLGIARLYAHQALAIDRVRGGRNTILVTGTASGKTLGYVVPILDRLASEPDARALLLYPTKALAQDQLRGLLRFHEDAEPDAFTAGTYDGDTPADHRRTLRDRAHCILTNPDMLHRAILPNHDRWARFFGQLRFVVIDEVHTYRGIFGSHVSNVIRRLHRVCRHYGSAPAFVCCSATIANPKELAERIVHRPFECVDDDGSPRGPKRFVLWNPPFLDEDLTQRRGSIGEATRLLADFVRERIQTIAFTRTRLGSELILRYLQDELGRQAPRLARSVCAYRSGYLPEERREIERRLAEGELLGVASTNALELGIDIGGLDACLIVGYPGSIASTWQQAGRAGRGLDEAAVFLIAQNSPIDQYLMHHPGYLFGKSPEHAVVDPDNPHIAIGHLRCALAELPLGPEELDLFGPHTQAMLGILQEHGQARKSAERWRSRGQDYPAGDVELRTATDTVYTIQDDSDGNRVIGTIDELGAYGQVHTHAVYLHGGETYFVNRLDTERKMAHVSKTNVDYYTQAVDDDKILIDEEEQRRQWRKTEACTGEVRVTTNWLMFKKVKFQTRESIGYEGLQLPTYTLETMALWLTTPRSALEACARHGRVATDGLVGIANLMVEVLPLFVLCDPSDVGAVVESANLTSPTLFVYDKYEGGIGFAEKAFTLLEEIMQAVLRVVQECPCRTGCPSCVGSATTVATSSEIEAGSRDRFPDKEAARILLHDFLEMPPYVPRYPPPGPPAVPPPTPVASPAPPRAIPNVPLPPNLEKKIRKRVRKYEEDA